ncbi:uncharacterized protein K02A2.6-like [Eupeodes corollae]|uniref:uncharacterized protein K02A2.6-like n=1 Tax=Eupeodes corollae TaxID=290404 RepID=UPI0024928F44|nr:uncharacterized protein K02A2.6-like [Eupeodes corollae]
MLQVLQYQPNVIYLKGKDIPVADTLSRDCHNPKNTEKDDELEVHEILQLTDITKKRLQEATKNEKKKNLQNVLQYVNSEWPDTIQYVPNEIKNYWTFRESLSSNDGLLFKGSKVVVPDDMKKEMMHKVHQAHFGIDRTLNSAREQLFWIKMTTEITKYVESCNSYSGYFDFVKLKQSSSAEVILQLKKMFAVHGIPFILESDNGPQFSSKEFKAFAKKWDFTHQTSSLRYPKSNGFAERFVQVAKSLLKKCHKDQSDVYLALLNYRNTPRSNDLLSPNQRLMSRRTRKNIPSSEQSLKPKVVQNVQHNLIEARNRSKFYADKGSHQKQPLQPGEKIRIQQPNRN